MRSLVTVITFQCRTAYRQRSSDVPAVHLGPCEVGTVEVPLNGCRIFWLGTLGSQTTLNNIKHVQSQIANLTA